MREDKSASIAKRIACFIVAAGIGLFISLMLFFWVEVTSLAVFTAIPIGCGIAGFIGGDKTLEVLKDIFRREY
jgi:hypothetical protein